MRLLVLLVAAAIAGSAAGARAEVQTPTVTAVPSERPGTPGRNYPFFATDIVLSNYGYVEEEFFYDGKANTYSTPAFGSNAEMATSGTPYRSRLLVRRPKDQSRFNGIVIVEWSNVTNGYDTDVLWLYQKEFFIREGYAWVGVSAQNVGVSRPPNGLKAWSPKRYASLNVDGDGTVPNDALSYDIYSQAAAAIRRVPAVLGGLRVSQVMAAGQSQSSGRLAIYLNTIHERDPIYDSAFLTVNTTPMRADLSIPVIKVLSETERDTSRNQKDSAKLRTWTVAGSTHSEQYSLLSRAAFLLRDLHLKAVDNCETPARSRVEIRYVYDAAVDALVKWKKAGTAPPNAPPLTFVNDVLQRDEYGNVLGGIRLAEMAVPVANESELLCGLGGTHVPLDAATLNRLYPTHADYVSKVTAASQALVKAGFLLPADAGQAIDTAKRSIYGMQLTCGDLCADVRQFPSHPSSMLLARQTAYLLIKDGDALVKILDGVTKSIAEGYTLGSDPGARRKFDEASAGLQAYVTMTRQLQRRGNMPPETASLLADQAAVLQQLTKTYGQSDWASYGQDPGGRKYSSLAQINTSNVSKLERAWTLHTGDTGGFFSSTPLIINNVMYFESASGIWAVEADTGKQIWKHNVRGAARRGVSYWPGDGQLAPRILTNIGTKLVALDAKTGTPITGFGGEGGVEMKTAWGSPPAIYKNYVITGGGLPLVRAWDLRTGALVWSFNLIAQPGDPGHETWEGDAWKDPGGTNVWGYLSVDVQNGLIFAPVSQAGQDYYGGERPGNNLYADCVVAIDANTGKLRWYQQTVHHDIWDYDLAAQPTLIDVLQNGRRVPAVVQHTKMGMLFIYDRLTGRPIFGVEERPVPQSTVEKTSPTQPFPVKPPPLARMSMTKDELYNKTPEHAAFCKDLWEKNNVFSAGPYTPWVLKESGKTTLTFPGAIGGGNWGGVAYDPNLGLIFANVGNNGQWGYLAKSADPNGRGGAYNKVTPFGQGNPARFRFWNPDTTWPCSNPPWGEFFAINANTGDIVWRVPLGSFPEAEAKGVKNAGTPNLGGAIATAGGLVFIAATVDGQFRAFDSETGRQVWQAAIDAPGHSIPATYLGRDGRQYIVIPAGGGGFLQGPPGDSLIAFALPR